MKKDTYNKEITNNKKVVILFALAFVTMSIFYFLNTMAVKLLHTPIDVVLYVFYTSPVQYLAYVGIVWYFKKSFQHFNNRYWIASLLFTFANYIANVTMAFYVLEQVPTSGQVVGIILTFVGTAIAILYK